MTQVKTMIAKQRCHRCGSSLFISQDPLDDPGTTYCLSGHTFAPAPPLPLGDEEPAPPRRRRRKKAKAATVATVEIEIVGAPEPEPAAA
jgi:hypothetical protein